MSDIELPDPIGEIVGRRLEPNGTSEFFGYFAEGYTGTQKERVYTADQLRAAILADREKRAQAAQGVERVKFERKVYRNGPEYREYLNARFGPAKESLSFPWQGHRWAYQFTGFDDAGDFDSLYRFESTEASKPVQAEAPKPGSLCDGRADCSYIDGTGRADCDLCNPNYHATKQAEAPTASKPAAASHPEFVSLEEHDRILQLVRQPTASNEREIMKEADRYWEASPAARFRVRAEFLAVIRAALATQQEAQNPGDTK